MGMAPPEGLLTLLQRVRNTKHYGSAGLEYGSWKTSRASLNYGTALTDKLSVSASYSGYASMEYRDRGHGKTWSGESFDYRNKKIRNIPFGYKENINWKTEVSVSSIIITKERIITPDIWKRNSMKKILNK